MATANRFEDLEIWQKARDLTKFVYTLTNNSRFQQDLRLKNQMRDASVSIMANIAEGFSRQSAKEFCRFLYIARGSGSELQSHFYVSVDQHYVSEPDFRLLYEKIDHILRMLSRFILYLRKPRKPDAERRTQNAT